MAKFPGINYVLLLVNAAPHILLSDIAIRLVYFAEFYVFTYFLTQAKFVLFLFYFAEMSISPSPENVRICLVGSVAEDETTMEAAKAFNVPIITSEIGTEIVEDSDWITYFVMHDFDGPVFDAIRKSKHRYDCIALCSYWRHFFFVELLVILT